MSDNAQVVMRLDPLAAQVRAQMVEDVTQWLEREGVIRPATRSLPERDQFGLAAWAPGSRWRAVVDFDPAVEFESRWHNGVDIAAKVELQSAMANHEDPTCGSCGVTLPSDESFGDLIEAWLSTGEPLLTCRSCGWTAPLGDWPTRFPPGLVGAPTITFHNWLPLRARFVDDLIARLGGGRCRYFWQHR